MTTPDPHGDELVRLLDTVARQAAEAYPGAPASWPYGPEPEQVIDLWGDPAPDVVVAVLHGGYFAAEYDRSGIETLCRRLVAEGFGVANIEYRRTGSVGDPLDTVHDVQRAIRWVVDRYPSAQVVALGHSAGGYLTLVGSTEPGVRAAVALAPATLLSEIAAGGYDRGALRRWVGDEPAENPQAWQRLAPERVGVGAVPIQVLHGQLDSVVPAEHTVRWVDERVAAGADVTVELLDGVGHYEFLDPDSPAADAVVAAVRRLLAGSLTWDEVARRFTAARNWWVVTAGSGGPHAVPVWGIVLDGALVLYGEAASVRARNLAADPRIVLHLESGDDVLVVNGTAHDAGAAGGSEVVNREFARKYTAHGDAEYLPDGPANADSRLWEVTPARALAWRLVPSPEWTTRRWSAAAPQVRAAYGSPQPSDA